MVGRGMVFVSSVDGYVYALDALTGTRAWDLQINAGVASPSLAGGVIYVIQNLRRGFYDLGTDVPSGARLADAFAELAQVI